MKTLLVNHVYYGPVGHVVEALKFARGFHEANSGLEIHVALNRDSPTELAGACPWIKKTYPIDIFEVLEKNVDATCLRQLPREWDYVVTDMRVQHDIARARNLGGYDLALGNYLRVSERLFTASRGKAALYSAETEPNNSRRAKLSFPDGLRYRIDAKVEIPIPQSAISFGRRLNHNDPKVCILLGGSGGYRSYPAIETWLKIIRALNESIPDLRIYLTGVRQSEKGRTATSGYTESHIRKVLESFRNVVDCYDIGLWNQLAIVKQSDVFVSPHTGFGFLAPCVGTPWLTISGGDWPEYFFNHVPFYSVLPDDPTYPNRGDARPRRQKGRPPRGRDTDPKRLEKKIPEIVEATRLLMSESFTYEDAWKRHRQNIQDANVRRDRLYVGPVF